MKAIGEGISSFELKAFANLIWPMRPDFISFSPFLSFIELVFISTAASFLLFRAFLLLLWLFILLFCLVTLCTIGIKDFLELKGV